MARSARLRSADDLIVPDVAAALRAVPDLTDADGAAKKLALRYAAVIDQAAITAAELAEVDCGEDVSMRVRVSRLAAAVEAQTVLDTLGPKLLAVLESLGATPKARAARKGGAAGGGSGQGKLAAIRAARTG